MPKVDGFCIFCGQRANSDEHIVAQRLYKRAKAEKVALTVGHLREGEPLKRRASHLFNTFTVKVCAQCNNGWMNDLEDWFERTLGNLIEPSPDSSSMAIPTPTPILDFQKRVVLHRVLHRGFRSFRTENFSIRFTKKKHLLRSLFNLTTYCCELFTCPMLNQFFDPIMVNCRF